MDQGASSKTKKEWTPKESAEYPWGSERMNPGRCQIRCRPAHKKWEMLVTLRKKDKKAKIPKRVSGKRRERPKLQQEAQNARSVAEHDEKQEPTQRGNWRGGS